MDSMSSKDSKLEGYFGGPQTFSFKDKKGVLRSVKFSSDQKTFGDAVVVHIGENSKDKFYFDKSELQKLPEQIQKVVQQTFQQALKISSGISTETLNSVCDNVLQELCRGGINEAISDRVKDTFSKCLPTLVAVALMSQKKSVSFDTENMGRTLPFKLKITSEGELRIKKASRLGEGGQKTAYKITKVLFSGTKKPEKTVTVYGKIENNVRSRFFFIPNRVMRWKRAGVKNEGNWLLKLRKQNVRHLLVCHKIKQKGKTTKGIIVDYCNEGDASKIKYRGWEDGKDQTTINAHKKKVLTIFQHVVEGIADMHKLGVCHSDIKPENVFLNKDSNGEVEGILADLGAAAKVKAKLTCWTNKFADIETKKKYFPKVTKEYDVWSLGIMLMELTKGDVHPLGYVHPAASYEFWLKAYQETISKLDPKDAVDQLILMCLQPASNRPSAEFLETRVKEVLSQDDFTKVLPDVNIVQYASLRKPWPVRSLDKILSVFKKSCF